MSNSTSVIKEIRLKNDPSRPAFQGHSRSSELLQIDPPPMTSVIVPYQPRAYLVTLSLRRTISEIFDFKYAVNLKTGLGVRQGNWKCHHSIERIWIPIDVLLQIWLYFVSFLKYPLWKNIATLKSQSRANQGHWKWYHSIEQIWFHISVI